MKSFLRLFSAFVLFGFFAADVWAAKPKILLLKDLKSGTKAIGFSVFKGVKPELFDVVLGEPMDYMGNSLILARISGGPMDTLLEKIGAVAGMSGSPIFIKESCIDLDDCVKNGTLVGALSYGPGSLIEGGPNALLTPIEYMLGARVGGYEVAAQFLNHLPDRIYIKGKEFVNLMLFPKMEMDNLMVQGESLGKCKENDSAGNELKPGSMVTVFFAEGSIPIGGSGTVTWRDDDKIYIFGHQFLGTGMVNYPFVHVAVADTIQTPVNPYKIAGCHLDTRGAMLVDGAFEMAGIIGRRAFMLPYQIELHLGYGVATLSEEIAVSPMASAIIKKLPVMWAQQYLGDLSHFSVAYQFRVSVVNQPEIFVKNMIPIQVSKNPFNEVFDNVYRSLQVLKESGFNYGIKSVNVRLDVIKDFRLWTVKRSFLSQEKASPGETIYVNVILEEFSNSAIKQMSIPIKVPEDFMERGISSNIMVLIQSGSKFTDKKELPELTFVEDLVKQLNQAMNYKVNVLYIQQIMPRSKAEEDIDRANAKSAIKPLWKWTDIGEGDLKQFPRNDKNEVVLTLSPALDDFIDLNLIFNIEVQPKKDVAIENKDKESKHRKWYLLFLL